MSDWADALKRYMELRDEEGELETHRSECDCDYDEFHQCDLCKQIMLVRNRQDAFLNRWGDTWATILYKNQIYEPPQTLAQRTMELTAEDPDTP